MRRARLSSVILIALGAASIACSGDLREEPVVDSIFDDPVEQRPVSEPVMLVERADDVRYGLPREGQPGIADLVALLPQESVGAGESDLWAAEGDAPRCPDPNRVTVLPELPMTIEGVVTLHPRQYLKVPVCDQDERKYGSYVVEDDTGGIVVLRNSRVAEFSAGDRVKLTVRSMMFTFRDPSTRVVLSADVERLDPPDGSRGMVIFETINRLIGLEDITRTRRVEGWVVQAPTNTNFGQLVVANKQVPVADDPTDATPVCRETCPTRCRAQQCFDACAELCGRICGAGANSRDEIDAALPVCWPFNVDAELIRRGFAPEHGKHVAVHGPAFNSYNLEIWVQRLGQIEVLDGE